MPTLTLAGTMSAQGTWTNPTGSEYQNAAAGSYDADFIEYTFANFADQGVIAWVRPRVDFAEQVSAAAQIEAALILDTTETRSDDDRNARMLASISSGQTSTAILHPQTGRVVDRAANPYRLLAWTDFDVDDLKIRIWVPSGTIRVTGVELEVFYYSRPVVTVTDVLELDTSYPVPTGTYTDPDDGSGRMSQGVYRVFAPGSVDLAGVGVGAAGFDPSNHASVVAAEHQSSDGRLPPFVGPLKSGVWHLYARAAKRTPVGTVWSAWVHEQFTSTVAAGATPSLTAVADSKGRVRLAVAAEPSNLLTYGASTAISLADFEVRNARRISTIGPMQSGGGSGIGSSAIHGYGTVKFRQDGAAPFSVQCLETVPVTPGRTYSAEVSKYMDPFAFEFYNTRCDIDWLREVAVEGSRLSRFEQVGVVNGAPHFDVGAVRRNDVTGVAPADATHARVSFRGVDSVDDTEWHVDQFGFYEGPLPAAWATGEAPSPGVRPSGDIVIEREPEGFDLDLAGDERVLWRLGLEGYDAEQLFVPNPVAAANRVGAGVALGTAGAAGPIFYTDTDGTPVMWLDSRVEDAEVFAMPPPLTTDTVYVVEGWVGPSRPSTTTPMILVEWPAAYVRMSPITNISGYDDVVWHFYDGVTVHGLPTAFSAATGGADPFSLDWRFRLVVNGASADFKVSIDNGETWGTVVSGLTITPKALTGFLELGTDFNTWAYFGRFLRCIILDGDENADPVAHFTPDLFKAGNRGNGATAVDRYGVTWTVTRPAAGSDVPMVAAAGVKRIVLPGAAGEYIEIPDTAANSITGDIDLRYRIRLGSGLTAPSGSGVGIAKYQSGKASFRTRWLTNGTLSMEWSTNGTSLTQSHFSPAFTPTANTAIWIRVTLDVSSGLVTYYFSEDQVSASADAAWSTIGTDTAGATSISDSAAAIEVGSDFAGAFDQLAGDFYRAEIYNGINGTLAVRFDAADAPLDADPVTGRHEWVDPVTGLNVRINRSTAAQRHVEVIDTGQTALIGNGLGAHARVIGGPNLTRFDPNVGLTLVADARIHDQAASWVRVMSATDDTTDDGIQILRNNTNRRMYVELDDGTTVAAVGDNADNIVWGQRHVLAGATGATHAMHVDDVEVETDTSTIDAHDAKGDLFLLQRATGTGSLSATLFDAAVVAGRYQPAWETVPATAPVDVDGTNIILLDRNVPPGVRYRYRAKVVRSTGESAPSPVTAFVSVDHHCWWLRSLTDPTLDTELTVTSHQFAIVEDTVVLEPIDQQNAIVLTGGPRGQAGRFAAIVDGNTERERVEALFATADRLMLVDNLGHAVTFRPTARPSWSQIKRSDMRTGRVTGRWSVAVDYRQVA